MNNEFFATIVTLNRDALSCSYVENDYALALQIILSTVAAIDTACVLLQRFNVVEHVEGLAMDYDASFSEPIVDKVSIYYRFVLSFVRSIGGQGEKSLPSLDVEQVSRSKKIAGCNLWTYFYIYPGIFFSITFGPLPFSCV